MNIPSTITVNHNDLGADRRHVAEQLRGQILGAVNQLRHTSSWYGGGYEQHIVKDDDKRVSAKTRKLMANLRALDEEARKLSVKRTAAAQKVKAALSDALVLSTRNDGEWHSYVIRESLHTARARKEGSDKARLAKASALDALANELLAVVAEGASIAEFPARFAKIRNQRFKGADDDE